LTAAPFHQFNHLINEKNALAESNSRFSCSQNNFDSVAYAKCFSETAVVFDEGKTHKGRKQIEQWIADANERYKAVMNR